MSDSTVTLRDAWSLRLAAAKTLLLAEEQLQAQVREASVEQIAALLESLSPAQTGGPEWTRSFDLLMERLWAWCSPETMAALEADFKERGPGWAAVANALSAERGAQLRGRLRQPPYARFPQFTVI